MPPPPPPPPTSVAISAAFGAALAEASILAIATWKAALLYGGLAAAQFLLQPRASAPNLQAARTQKILTSEAEPERFILGRQRVGGLLCHFEENGFWTTGVTRADGADNKTNINAWQHGACVLYLASHPLTALERLWIEGVEQPIRYGTTWTRPWPRPDPTRAPRSRQDYLQIRDDLVIGSPEAINSPIVPPRFGPWGIGNGTSDGDETDPRVSERISGTTRNLEWERWPYIIWPRITGEGKPPYAQARAGRYWWTGDLLTEERGGRGHSYLLCDFYQNQNRKNIQDEDVDESRQGYNWKTFPIDVQVLAKGMQIRFPENAAGELGQPAWSDNPAVIAWWILHEFIGLPVAALDPQMFIDAREICAERMPDNGGQADDPRGFDPARDTEQFGTDTVVVSGDNAIQILREVAFSMDGALTTSGGRIAMQPGRSRTVTHNVEEKDIIGMTVQAQPPSSERSNRANMVLRQSALHDWGVHPMGEVRNRPAEFTDGAIYETDMGTRTAVSSPVRANLLMQSELEKIRVPFGSGREMAPVYTIHMKSGDDDEHLEIRVLERITVSWEPFGLSNLELEVLSMEVSPDWEITLIGRANGADAIGLTPVHCPGFGDPPPAVPAAADATGHVATLYAATTTLMPEIV